jgi:trans-aconitate methyltransferase
MIKWNPEEYHKNSSQIEKWAKELLSKFSLKGNEIILDIGSGDGKITAEISKLLPNGKIVGIDSSIEMNSYSKSKFSTKEYPNLDFVLMDVNDIKFEKEFDIVFSNATLHWLTNHIAVLNQIHKCLKPFGTIFLQMGGKGNQEILIQVLEDIIKSEKWDKYLKGYRFQYGYYGIEEYKKWLNDTGFFEKRVEFIKKDNVLSGKEGLAEWNRMAFSPYVQNLPDNLQKEFIYEIADNYIRKYPLDEHGSCHISMIRLEVEAFCLK